MRIYFEYLCVTALVVLLPPTSIPHFIAPLDFCLLADLCNHTWIPECADENGTDYRLFIDECDLYEYNCDYKREYTITNYSECFQQTCPPMVTCKKCPGDRRGNWAFRANKGRFELISLVTLPMHHRHRHGHGRGHDHDHDFQYGEPVQGQGPYRHLTALRPIRTPGVASPNRRRYKGKHTTTPVRTTKATTRAKKKPPRMKARRATAAQSTPPTILKEDKGTTKQVLRTGTTSTPGWYRKTVVLKRMTVLRNGKMWVKVIKGFLNTQADTPVEKSDSDFLQ
ncbi:uncharacterized protein LOC142982394 [Anticarsia gemmatalis]|uniref:uncharacterized protein LOC142982394 n=1 Tax=Anticarsia gemmatalis TaxID=129554 RepID=UPI003F7736D5